MKKIYAILVAYNPQFEDIKEAVSRLELQVDKVVLCNNSDFSLELQNEKVHVFNFGENLGIAKAQSIGMLWAFEDGADFVLQMDQDSIPHDDLSEKLLICYEDLTSKGLNIGLVGSQDYDKDTKQESIARYKKGKPIAGTNYIQVEQILSSGSLIPKKAYETIGGMDDDLFIDAVDFEYCWRLIKNGFFVVKNPEALIAHKLGDGLKSILSFSFIVPAPVRHYYQFRNLILLSKRGYVPFYWKMTMLIKYSLSLLLTPFIFNKRIERARYMLSGIKDGFLGRRGAVNV